jgi:hypothetical protein
VTHIQAIRPWFNITATQALVPPARQVDQRGSLGCNNKRIDPLGGKGCKNRVDVALAAGLQNLDLS